MTVKQFDIFRVPEVGLYWPTVHQDWQFQKQLNKQWALGTTKGHEAYNKHEERQDVRKTKNQWGGTAMICKDAAAMRWRRDTIPSPNNPDGKPIPLPLEDPHGLGRWVC